MVCLFHVGLLKLADLYLQSYTGIEQSKLADLPFDVLREGHRIAEELALLDARQRELSTTNRIAQRRKVLLTVSVDWDE
jgi:hypothetical protein